MKHNTRFNLLMILGLVLALSGGVVMAHRALAQEPGPEGQSSIQAAVGDAFTYQGRLLDSDTPVDGTCDFQFNLYDDAWLSPSLVAGPVDRGAVTVSDGYFSTSIDFGASAFTGEGRQLEILVRCPAGSGSYTTLSGMVTLSANPYALSLRPGAVIEGSVSLGAVVKAENTYSGALFNYGLHGVSQNTGVQGEAASTTGKGVYGEATATSGTNYGVYGKTNSSSGYGVYGTSPSTNPIYAGVIGANTGGGNGSGVYGYSLGGRGVYGLATVGTGVYGTGSTTGTVGIATGSGNTYGVYGKATSLSGRGVYGEGGWFGVYGKGTDPTGYSYGVYGEAVSTNQYSYGGQFRNNNNIGLYAEGNNAGFRSMGDIRLAGGWGVIGADDNSDSSISLLSNDEIQLWLDNDNNDDASHFEIYDPGYSTFWPVFDIDHNGDLYAAGNIACGGTKSAVVDTENYGTRKLYAVESPELWFEDFGASTLVNGVATVGIEPIFAETVNLDEYHVFLTPLGDCNGLYVAAKTPTSFEVHELGGGTSSISFDYRIVAHRLGYEDVRLEEVER
ncbi:MAG: hypothetical protein U9R05_06320 [Chloroflexota bacterium]|nr:hypothetical protein [Chloroflexota bacterium]